MRSLALLLCLAVWLNAAGGFWPELMQTEQRFYAAEQNATAETNASAGPDDQKTTAIVDAKFAAFKALVGTMKAQPFSVQSPKNPFYGPQSGEEELFKLRARISINTDHGYTFAVDRDKIAVDVLRLKQRIYVFFASLSAVWTDRSREELAAMLQDELQAIAPLKPSAYEKQYPADTGETGSIRVQLDDNLAELKMHYFFYSDLLNYLRLNPGLLHYESLVQRLQLGRIISAINDNRFASDINGWLRYVKLDLGRAVLFAAILFVAWAISVFMYKHLYLLLRRLILRKEDLLDEMMLANMDDLRRPTFVLTIAFGLETAIEVLRYPSASESGAVFFYFIYLMTLSYMVIIVVDNLFFHFLLKRAKAANREMRRELVNFILSIIKIIVFIIAGMLMLVRLGINITGLLASLGIGGLAVALAAKDTLSNFFGLLKIISDNSFSQGDWIQAGDIEGTVVEIGFISTEVRTFDNALITVPNSTLANAALKNFTRRNVGRRIKMHIGVTYGSDRKQLAAAVDAIRQMLYDHPGITVPEEYDQDTFTRRARQTGKLVSVEDKFGIKTTLMVYLDQLSSSSMDILIYAFTKSVNWQEWLEIKQDVIFKIWEILEAHDLEFAFPSQSLYFEKENIRDTFGAMGEKTAMKNE